MRTKVGQMPYLNCEVFYRRLPSDAFGQDGGFELLPMAPRPMARAFERGELDAGPLPLAEVLRLDERARPLGDLCVATRDEAASVLLLARRPVEELTGATIAVTDQTATSVQLLRILLSQLWRVTPRRLAPPGSPSEAVLLIGDDALRARKGIDGYPLTYDLGKEWRSLTGLPMVFATWVIRRDAEPATASRLLTMLEMSLERSLREIGMIAAERRDVGLTELQVVEYLGYFVYRMGPDERRAVEAFREALGRLPAWRPADPERGARGAPLC